jgi:hypothetical protein
MGYDDRSRDSREDYEHRGQRWLGSNLFGYAHCDSAVADFGVNALVNTASSPTA